MKEPNTTEKEKQGFREGEKVIVLEVPNPDGRLTAGMVGEVSSAGEDIVYVHMPGFGMYVFEPKYLAHKSSNSHEKPQEFVTKDSGERQEFSSGMHRDTQTGKPRYDLCDKAMYKRWAELMARGAEKYGENNWRKANSEEELARFKASAERHLMQWIAGDVDEDHGAAVLFNIAAGEYVKAKLKNEQ